MSLKRFNIIVFVLLVANFSFGQDTTFQVTEKRAFRVKGLAKEATRTGNPYIALEYYKKLVELKPDKDAYALQLADLYMYTRNYIEAEQQFRRIVEKAGSGKDAIYPDAIFYWAVMQKQTGDYEGAKANLLKFKKVARRAVNPSLSKLYKSELAGCDLAIGYRDSLNEDIIEHLPESVNNPHIDFSPIPLSQTKLVFGSLREKKEKYYHRDSIDSMELPVRKFYVAEKIDGNWEFKGEWEGPFNSEEEDIANGTFSLDSSRFYFTRCAEDWKYKVNCKIYFSEKSEAGWGDPELMGEHINMPGFTASHPTVGRESKRKQEVIYFVSDRPGGKGGMDIWYTEYNARKKTFKNPSNAGSKINSPGIEMTPYYNMKTRTLYYSTNGKPNIGGLDIFKTKGEKKKFEPSVNLGMPINSKEDDLDFVLYPNSKGGYFVSNRVGGQSLYNETCCDDIYEFKYNDFIELIYCGNIVDKETMNCAEEPTKLKIYIVDELDRFLADEVTVTDCNFNVQLQPGFNYYIEARTDGYFNGKARVSTYDLVESDSLCKDIEIRKIPPAPIVLKDIYYAFNSPSLTDKAKIAIDTTLLTILTENPEIIIEISSHTDSKGEEAYNNKLSQKRAESVVKYLVEKEIHIERLQAKGYGESVPIAPNENEDGSDNPEGRRQNRRTEFKIIGIIDVDVFYDDGYDAFEDEDDYEEYEE